MVLAQGNFLAHYALPRGKSAMDLPCTDSCVAIDPTHQISFKGRRNYSII